MLFLNNPFISLINVLSLFHSYIPRTVNNIRFLTNNDFSGKGGAPLAIYRFLGMRTAERTPKIMRSELAK